MPVSLAALIANANFGLHRECMWQALPLPSCMANIKFCEMFLQAKDNFLYANNFPFFGSCLGGRREGAFNWHSPCSDNSCSYTCNHLCGRSGCCYCACCGHQETQRQKSEVIQLLRGSSTLLHYEYQVVMFYI